MERRKEKRSKSPGKEPRAQKASDDKVSLDQWFHEEVKNQKLKVWQLPEISVFLKNQGLSERENREAYQRALAKY